MDAQAALEIQDFNNQQQRVEEGRNSFVQAMKEIANLERGKSRKSQAIRVGFILRAHGYIFELTDKGWILRPSNYLCTEEVEKRYCGLCKRKVKALTAYYKMRHAQKNWRQFTHL